MEPNCKVKSHKSLAKTLYAINNPLEISYILIGVRAANTVTQRNSQTSLALNIKATFAKREIGRSDANIERSRAA